MKPDRQRERSGVRSARYPGLIAPASLKLDKSLDSALRDRRYPGLIAPASLKPVEVGLAHREAGGYPGLIAPASLKRRRFRARTAPVQPLSGVNRPGLIEAVVDNMVKSLKGELSGVNRPGLIEATLASGRPEAGAMVIRG